MYPLLLLFSLIRFRMHRHCKTASSNCNPCPCPKRNKAQNSKIPSHDLIIISHNNLVPLNYMEITLKDMLAKYLFSTITVFVSSNLRFNSFSGILIRVANDYIQLMKIKYITFPLIKTYKTCVIDIPINYINAVSYKFR